MMMMREREKRGGAKLATFSLNVDNFNQHYFNGKTTWTPTKNYMPLITLIIKQLSLVPCSLFSFFLINSIITFIITTLPTFRYAL